MQSRARVLSQLIDGSLYQVDGPAVANAIMARALVCVSVADPSFRSERHEPQMRSFRRDRELGRFA